MNKDAASPGNNARFLCEHPAHIKPVLEESASPHPLGLGIRNNHTLKYPGGAVRLPKSDVGLEDLRRVTDQPIESLSKIYHKQAWRSLLVAPALLARLPDPYVAAHHYQVEPSVGRGQSLEAFVVGSVVRPPSALLTDSGLVEEEPLAGVGCLLVQTDARMTLRAWLRAKWTTTTRTLCRELEELNTALSLQFGGRRRRALLLTSGQRSRASDDALTTCAMVLGFDLAIMAPVDAETTVRQRPPAVTMAEESAIVPQEVTDAVKAHNKEIYPLHDDDNTLLLEEMRERLTSAAFLTPALACRAVPAKESPDDYRTVRRAELPIARQGQRYKHRTTGFVYVEDADLGCYLTRDRANHSQDRRESPVAYKRFHATKTALVWDADLDQHGQEIGADVKHKGDRLKIIPWSDLDSC